MEKSMSLEKRDYSADRAILLHANASAGLTMLLQAREYILADLDCCGWDFAVEIRLLREAGLTHSDLRWLIRRGYVEHGIETTRPGMPTRSFMKASSLAFEDDTCFLLTDSGASFVRQFCAEGALAEALPGNGRSRAGLAECVLPDWNSEVRELRLGGILVKQFRQPAESQEIILSAFQEEGWQPHIDDPLPPRPDQNPKRHLHVTITNLNRHQKNRLIHFRGDGTGLGVVWEPLPGYATAPQRQ
jgi:hypothetical protein